MFLLVTIAVNGMVLLLLFSVLAKLQQISEQLERMAAGTAQPHEADVPPSASPVVESAGQT